VTVPHPHPPILLVTLLALAATAVVPRLPAQEEIDDVYRSANADFETGDFEQAALKYLGLVEDGRISAELYYNLGTTRFRQDRPGEAILWMRRAQLVEPDMPEASQNLEFLRRRLAFLEFADSEVDRIIRALPKGAAWWAASVAFWLGLIALAGAFLVPRLRGKRGALVVLAAVSLFLAMVAWRVELYRDRRLAPDNFAIVVGGKVAARTSPAPDAEPVIELPPGSEVRVVQESGPWRYVDIPGGVRGWLRREEAKPVWPIEE